MAFNPQEHMLQLKGKDYLQVMWRLVWFREEHPDWGIRTEMVSHDAVTGAAVFKAQILDREGVVVSMGYGSETKRDFGDYLEKAETKAVGRALAMLGYGTQFAPELDEGERIVDSPVPPKNNVQITRIDTPEEKTEEPLVCERCGKPLKDVKLKGGKVITAVEVAKQSKITFGGAVYCCDCGKAMKAAKDGRERT